MPGREPTALVKRQKDVPRGQVRVKHLPTESLVTGDTRRVYFYEPPAAGPYPLLVVWDGEDYLRKAWLARIVDNLIHQGRISPVGMALIDSGGSSRTPELACSEGTLAFLVDQVIPEAWEQLNLTDIEAEPSGWGLLGASLGGLMALFTALRLPHLFGKVISQSGAFNQLVDESMIFDLAARSGSSPLNIWMETGIMENLVPENRRMRDILNKRKHSVTYNEISAGHNYTAWRDEVWRGLETVFPPVQKSG
jgi:enterochelin esterase family protein